MNPIRSTLKAIHPRILELQGKHKKPPLPVDVIISQLTKKRFGFKLNLETIFEE